jgi:hypothetical protein
LSRGAVAAASREVREPHDERDEGRAPAGPRHGADRGGAARRLRTFHRGHSTTAAPRTEGPTPPFCMYPQDVRSMQEWTLMSRNTKFCLGSVLLALGHDSDNNFDRRVWIVGVPLQVQP